jgi:hypothetical protein
VTESKDAKSPEINTFTFTQLTGERRSGTGLAFILEAPTRNSQEIHAAAKERRRCRC